MALNKYKLGDLISVCDERNSEEKYILSDVKGISIKKEFIETKADMVDVSLKPYKIVKPDYFSYVTVTSRNGEKITIAHNNSQNTYIVSSSYIVFKVNRKDLLDSYYLYMYFNRPEFDRYARFSSWGSARETFSWDDICNVEIELPSIEIQKKYVAIYKSMLENQKCYERGLEDLKLVCDAYFDKNKNKNLIALEKLIKKQNKKNTDFKVKKLIGIGKDGIIPPKQDKDETNGHICYLVNYKDFVFAPPQVHNGSLDLYMGSETVKCSDAYYVFRIIDENVLLPEYLKMYLKTPQFQHYAFYYRDGVREQFDYEQLKEHRIFLPSMEEQKSIIEIFKILEKRKTINEKLKSQIKNICPILIKGSIEEEKTKEV